MRIIKTFLGALGVTIVSCVLLTVINGKLNIDRLAVNMVGMFIVSFAVLLMYTGKNEKQS